MAKVRKRGNSYQIDYYDPNGKRVRISFRKKKEAEAELGKRVSLIAENRYLDVKKDYKTTLGGLLKKYIENYQTQASFKTFKKYTIESLKNWFGEETRLSNIRYVDVETYRNHLRQKLTKSGSFRKEASINRAMACLSHILNKAVEWDMMERSPFDRGKSLLLKENNRRLRFLNEDEIERLLNECPEYLRSITECALHTGMRKGEILSLKWSQIRNGQIYLRKTKTNEAREIPISDHLAKVLKEIRKKSQLRSEYVFTYKGTPVQDVKRAFGGALRRAKIEDFRFHDLRHTFASHMVMRGATLKEVQELLGHKDMKMTMRYAHLSQEHKKKAVNLLNGLTPYVKFDKSQMVTNPPSEQKKGPATLANPL
jgi:integrase